MADIGLDDYTTDPNENRTSISDKIFKPINQRYQLLLDLWTPHVASRWIFSIVILLLFMTRVILAQGWYIICYGLSIYYLNLFIGFLSPKIDPAFRESEDYDDGDGMSLPTHANEEFKPFIRRLPEFKFWYNATKATIISLVLSMFEIFDLPVFWPILLLYFIILFVMTMRQQIKHMWKYRYVPWNRGKQRYGGNINNNKEDSARLFSAPT